ncbi:MAG: efflux RND transporter periplasmic adaptor subunit [Rhodobacteraceae bacterium]|nr:efflux RND transporter periplasmic adaptor subunit [Paracoccaceae bacterium]
MSLSRCFRTLTLLAALAGAPITAALAQGPAGERPPSPVTVVTVNPQDITLTATLPGRVVASASAEVRPQVAGIITKRTFNEGGTVQAGDVLFTIDPASYAAAVSQAQAQVAAAQAQLAAAERDERRAEELLSRNVTSQQTVDDAITERDQAKAQLLVAEAQLQAAQIELDRTTIYARLSGEIGRSEISEGALVTASQTAPLAVIRTIDPVYVDVTQSAADLLRWRRHGSAAKPGLADHAVVLTLADGTGYEHTGTLTAAEPHVDEQTGVVVLRIEFANPDKFLLPGMYVQVEMPSATASGVYMVPQEGVTRDRRGRPLAWVVNADNVVEQRELSVLQDRGDAWVVDDGLAAGDRVIVAGFQKTGVGATVAPEERSDAAPEAPAN